MAYLQGLAQKRAESPESFRAEFCGRCRFLVKNLYKIRTFARKSGPIMSRHSFDPKIAARVGLNVAVSFQNITFWIEKNQANRGNLRDRRY